MITLFNRFKTLMVSALTLVFFLSIAATGCTPKEDKSSTEEATTESAEAEGSAAEESEHPSSGSEHPSAESEADTTETSSEHPG
jgi:hypothetical protein